MTELSGGFESSVAVERNPGFGFLGKVRDLVVNVGCSAMLLHGFGVARIFEFADPVEHSFVHPDSHILVAAVTMKLADKIIQISTRA